ncbi:ATP-binding cassette domain-containing protein [Staphylococcus xylosus]|uniref:Sal family ABC-F type ribosomal protection protein n=1 Tax=Staphylococcus xylosus TaxID=1288 RepID=UPI000C34F3E6|nr:Sal family ABC-F type ribosomal protection protein [Staphylococcus xylosus]MCM3517721.1 ATP-binding cassette domain-containing protein [Staphylococcus xylosus]MCQ3815734.1 ABC transporter ATP-binding protein [Staphylococcus xylosus]MCQ3818437.1 ABC transporter ATP-binding protein [Staphylococcus xylosus]PKI05526.1 ABC transporter ATP-binding protein [Staphylococcus xylosus]UBV38579.1 ABC-F family ATP-binding cassette domain-containing protein [Staphylococcus xylosus]
MSFYYEQKPFEQYGRILIDKVLIDIEEGEHVAFIGDNGVGKSTLLYALKNAYKESAYLMEQDMTDYYEMTALDFLLFLKPQLAQLKKEMLNNYEKISDYVALEGYEFEQEIITQAKLFDLTEIDLDKKIKSLSGGQQTRVAILRAFLSKKSLILLDEPTNHLDMTMLDNLITNINKSKQTIVFVSHHRGFINQTASHIYQITRNGTRKFQGDYDHYKHVVDLAHQSQVNAYEKQQKEVKALEATIRRVNEWHSASQRTTSVRDPIQQKRLSKLAQKAKVKESQLKQKINEKQIETPENDNREFHFNEQTRLRKRSLIRFENVSITINQQEIYRNANFEMKNKENIFLTGPNGSGKSLFIAMIKQSIKPNKGDIYITPSLNIASFDQQNSNLKYNSSPLDMVMALESVTRSEAQTILATFDFNNEKINQHIAFLSMGEKSRLQFVLLYFSNPHLLILDEPTNYFDIATQDLILKMIDSFQGQVLIVTHDHYLQSRINATHWHINDKKLQNMTLNSKQPADIKNTMKLLEDFKDIDENGHFETDN